MQTLQRKKSIFTYHVRPKKADDYEIDMVDLMRDKKVCIILQGNICYKYNFTYETIKLYKKMYPNSIIILSTWNNEKKRTVNEIKELGVYVIESELPTNNGHSNINYQLKSTIEAIKFAEKQNVEYILKTRTDQRLCSEMNITYFLDLLKEYPMRIDIENAKRIVVCSNGCFSNRLYNVTDMVLFGELRDIKRYFSAPIDTRNGIDYSQENLLEYSKNRPGEIYISTHYIESLGFELKWTESDSKYYMKELFIIVDSESLDWVWLKYTMREYRWRKYKDRKLIQMTHKDWLRLYMEESV